nr:unnamed protein product [Digitaria exilis]
MMTLCSSIMMKLEEGDIFAFGSWVATLTDIAQQEPAAVLRATPREDVPERNTDTISRAYPTRRSTWAPFRFLLRIMTVEASQPPGQQPHPPTLKPSYLPDYASRRRSGSHQQMYYSRKKGGNIYVTHAATPPPRVHSSVGEPRSRSPRDPAMCRSPRAKRGCSNALAEYIQSTLISVQIAGCQRGLATLTRVFVHWPDIDLSAILNIDDNSCMVSAISGEVPQNPFQIGRDLTPEATSTVLVDTDSADSCNHERDLYAGASGDDQQAERGGIFATPAVKIIKAKHLLDNDQECLKLEEEAAAGIRVIKGAITEAPATGTPSGRIAKSAADIIPNRDTIGRITKWPVKLVPPEHWIMYFDGSLKLEGEGAGVLLLSPIGQQLKYVLQIKFPVSNTEAKYEVILHGPWLAIFLSIKRLMVYGDSMLLEKHFLGLEFHHVECDLNVGVDVLSKFGSSRAKVPCGVFVNKLSKPSIKEQDEYSASLPEVMVIEADWTQPLISYIKHEVLREDKAEAERIVRRRKLYTIRSAHSSILMKCVSQAEGIGILEEIHFGECGNHATSRTLVRKASLANGQVKRANALVLDGLCTKVEVSDSKKERRWMKELYPVVWGRRTQPSNAMGQSPFFMVYGSEAILPVDKLYVSLRVHHYDEGEIKQH